MTDDSAQGSAQEPARRDGLAAVAIFVVTICLIVVVVTSLI